MPADIHTHNGVTNSTPMSNRPVLLEAGEKAKCAEAKWTVATSLTDDQPGAYVMVLLSDAGDSGLPAAWAGRHFDPDQCRRFGEALIRAAEYAAI